MDPRPFVEQLVFLLVLPGLREQLPASAPCPQYCMSMSIADLSEMNMTCRPEIHKDMRGEPVSSARQIVEHPTGRTVAPPCHQERGGRWPTRISS